MIPKQLLLPSFIFLKLSLFYLFHLFQFRNTLIISYPSDPIITTDNLISSSLLNSLLSQAEHSFITPATITSNNQFAVRGTVSNTVNLSCTSVDKSSMIISDRIASFVGVPSHEYISRISVSRLSRPTSRPFSSLLPPHQFHNQNCAHLATAYLYLDDVHIGGESLFRFGNQNMSETIEITPKKGRLSVAYITEDMNMERATREVKKGVEIVAVFVVMNCKLRSPCKNIEDETNYLKDLPQASQEILIDEREMENMDEEQLVDDEEEEEEEEEEDFIDEYEWNVEEDEEWDEMTNRLNNETRLEEVKRYTKFNITRISCSLFDVDKDRATSQELMDLRNFETPWKSGIAGFQSILVSEL